MSMKKCRFHRCADKPDPDSRLGLCADHEAAFKRSRCCPKPGACKPRGTR